MLHIKFLLTIQKHFRIFFFIFHYFYTFLWSKAHLGFYNWSSPGLDPNTPWYSEWRFTVEESEDYDDKSWLAVHLLELWFCLLNASLGCSINAGLFLRGLPIFLFWLKGILWAVSGYSASFSFFHLSFNPSKFVNFAGYGRKILDPFSLEK